MGTKSDANEEKDFDQVAGAVSIAAGTDIYRLAQALFSVMGRSKAESIIGILKEVIETRKANRMTVSDALFVNVKQLDDRLKEQILTEYRRLEKNSHKQRRKPATQTGEVEHDSGTRQTPNLDTPTPTDTHEPDDEFKM